MFEEIGKRVAELLLRDNPSLTSDQSEPDHHEHLLHSLGHSIQSATHGLNERAGSDVLTVITKHDSFQFNLGYEQTATLRVGSSLLGLIPSKKNAESNGSTKFTTCNGHDGFQFKAVSSDPTIPTPTLSQEQFVEGVLKVACNKSFFAE